MPTCVVVKNGVSLEYSEYLDEDDVPPWRKKGYGVCKSGALGCYPSRLCSTCKLKVRSRCCLQLTRFCRATLKTILRKGPLPETPIASAKDANGMRSMTHVYCDCDLCTEMIQRCAKIFELRIVSTNKPIASSGAVMIRLVWWSYLWCTVQVAIVNQCCGMCYMPCCSWMCSECAVVFCPGMQIQCVLQITAIKSGCENRKHAKQESMQCAMCMVCAWHCDACMRRVACGLWHATWLICDACDHVMRVVYNNTPYVNWFMKYDACSACSKTQEGQHVDAACSRQLGWLDGKKETPPLSVQTRAPVPNYI